MLSNLDSLRGFWAYWMESLRTGQRHHIPFTDAYLHQGVLDFLTPFWLLAALLIVAAVALHSFRRRA